MFNELDGIEKTREIIQQKKTTLEILIDTAQSISNKYGVKAEIINKSLQQGQIHAEKTNELYILIYNDITSLPAFTEQDIQSFLHAAGSNDNLYITKKIIFALYSGTLLHLLTERNQKEGKKTIMHVADTHFDWLFSFVKKADTIIIENCTGDYILAYAGAFEGSIDTIVINNSKGIRLLDELAFNKGSINTIAIAHVKSNNVMYNLAEDHGTIQNIIASDIQAETVLCKLANNYGYIGNIMVSDINSRYLLRNVANYYGSIKNIIVSTVQAKYMLDSTQVKSGSISNLIISDAQAEYILDDLLENDNGNVKNLFVLNLKTIYSGQGVLTEQTKLKSLTLQEGKYSFILQFILPKQNHLIIPDEYMFEENLELYGINRILRYISGINGKSATELLSIKKQIQAMCNHLNNWR